MLLREVLDCANFIIEIEITEALAQKVFYQMKKLNIYFSLPIFSKLVNKIIYNNSVPMF